jgi:HEAT repeat protein
MFNPDIFAVNLGRTLELLQATPPNKEQQKACLRAVYALTSLASATIRLYDGVLSVDDSVLPADLPFGATLARQMGGHGIAEIVIGRGTSATELLMLLKALAVQVGAYPPGDGVAARLAAARASGIAVLGARSQTAPGSTRPTGVTRAFELAEIEAAAAEEAPSPPPSPSEAPPAPGPGAAPLLTEAIAAWEPRPAPAGPEPGPQVPPTHPESASLPAPSGIPTDTLIGSALGIVLRNPYGEGILDRLSELAGEIGNALREGRLELAVQAMAAVVGLEPAAPDGSARASYGIVLRRVLTREALRRVAHLLPDPRFTPVATAVLQRAGSDAAEVLVDLLSNSEVPRERRAYLAALRVIPHGTEAVIQMLGHYQWFVVRNVAELLGEMRVEEAVPALAMLLTHRESRVQRAAAVALARIGTVATVEPLRRALHEGSPELRGLVAASVGGAHSRALSMPLVALADAEENADVRAEYYRALGRIGSPEAVEALIKAVQPGGRVFGRRATGPRVAAVEGLRNAGGVAARRALQDLTEDADKPVRDAAARALAAGAESVPPEPSA